MALTLVFQSNFKGDDGRGDETMGRVIRVL